MQHERFRSGELTTGFIAEEYPEGFEGAPADEQLLRRLSAMAGFMATATSDRAKRVDQQLNGAPDPQYDWAIRIGETSRDVTITEDEIVVDGEAIDLSMEYTPGDRIVHALFDADEDGEGGDPLTVQVRRTNTGLALTTRGATHELRILPAHVAPLAQHMIEKEPPDLSKMLICPMPGLLVSLHVEEGEEVQPGQPLATVEAMKMENILRAEKEGTIAKINAAEGDSLAVDAVILELE